MVNRKYTEEFKAEAVRQVRERGYSVQEVARRIGVSPEKRGREVEQGPDEIATKPKRTEGVLEIADRMVITPYGHAHTP